MNRLSILQTLVSLTTVTLLALTASNSASNTGFSSYSQKLPGTGVAIDMVAIKGGSFTMGSPKNEAGHKADEGPQHQVNIPPFWMGKYEITWQQYQLFMQRNIDELVSENAASSDISIKVDGVSGATPPYVDMSFGMGKINYPAINMTQYAASQYCKWLTAMTGHFYRLPTEAEWEYACRAGTKTAYHFDDNKDQLDNYAWYYENSDDKYHQVGLKLPNPWGLHDMHGNVAEWTLDQYDASYYNLLKGKESKNEWNKPTTLYPRTTRGGSWYDDAKELRSAARKPSQKKWKQRDPQIPKSLWWHTNAPIVGFRIVRPLNTPTSEEMESYWIQPIKEM